MQFEDGARLRSDKRKDAATSYSSERWSTWLLLHGWGEFGLRSDERKDVAKPYLSVLPPDMQLDAVTSLAPQHVGSRPAKQGWNEFPGQTRVIEHAGAPIRPPELGDV